MQAAPGWFPGTYWEILLQAPVEGASLSRPKVRNPPGGWHLSPPIGGPGDPLPFPGRDQLVPASCPGGGGVPHWRGAAPVGEVHSTPGGRKLSDGQTDSPRQLLTPSLARPGRNNRSPRRGGAEGAAAQTHPGGAGPARSRSGGQGLGTPRPRPPRLPPPGGWDPGAGSSGESRSREAMAERAHCPFGDQDGNAGSEASERRRAGWWVGERQRAVPAGSRLRPGEAPPTSRPSFQALCTTPKPGAQDPSCGGRAPTPSRPLVSAGVGWGRGRGRWAQVHPPPQPQRVDTSPPGSAELGVGWGSLGRRVQIFVS